MLQIRLSKGGSTGDGGGGGAGAAARPSLPSETVTVACPDHLVIADLPVAKSLGTTPSSNTPNIVVKSVGRRSRRHLGERVHFCVCCDFPIAIYGRLIPCEHAFCLTCARSDSSCYLCDERILKIQTIKMMEGIVICAAPHCLKSFLKRSEFESHVHEVHADLLQPEIDREGATETDPVNITRPPSADSLANKSAQPESSTARAPPRPGFSPNSSSQLSDREDRVRRHQSREPTPMRPPLQQMPVPLPFHNHQLQQSAELLLDNNQQPQGIWFKNPQASENLNAQQNRRDSDQFLPDKHMAVPSESPFTDFSQAMPFQLPNYPLQIPLPMPVVVNPVMTPSQFSYPTLPVDGSQSYYNTSFEMQRPETMQEQGQDQSSVLGFPPSAGSTSFPDYSRQWNTAGFVNMQFESVPVVQGNPEGAPLHLAVSLPPPPPLPPPSMSQQYRRGSFSGSSEVP